MEELYITRTPFRRHASSSRSLTSLDELLNGNHLLVSFSRPSSRPTPSYMAERHIESLERWGSIAGGVVVASGAVAWGGGGWRRTGDDNQSLHSSRVQERKMRLSIPRLLSVLKSPSLRGAGYEEREWVRGEGMRRDYCV